MCEPVSFESFIKTLLDVCLSLDGVKSLQTSVLDAAADIRAAETRINRLRDSQIAALSPDCLDLGAFEQASQR
jgi:hypothetical protein